MNQHQDPLMQELTGELPPLAPGESAPIPAASREAELTVEPKNVPSAVQAANAVHSTKAGGKGFRVVVKGEYYADNPTGKGKISKPYAVEVNLPSLDAALSVIKNNLLDGAIRRKYPDFVSVRTNAIEEVFPLSPETPMSRNLAYMNRAQLEAHVLSSQPRIPIDVAAYPEVTDLRDAIIDYTQTPAGFEAREAVRQLERKNKADLKALNPEIEVGA